LLNTQPLEINSFVGGITDHVFSQNLQKAAEMDNFVILSNQSIFTRPGSVIDDLVNGQIPAGVQRIGCMINYDSNEKLFIQSARKFYYRNPSAYTTLTGPSGNDVFSVGTTAASPSFSQWNRHIFVTNDEHPRPMKIFKDSGGVYRVRSSGLPALATPPTGAGTVGVNSYVYALHYFYSYTVGTQTFQDAGPVTFVEVPAVNAPDVNAITISSIPVISNGATENFDTANIKVWIFRTINGGIDFYKVGEITNGTTSFIDNIADTVIIDNELVYINDGTLDNEPPPAAKYLHIVNNTGYYASLKEGTEFDEFTIQQSTPFDPDSCPGDFRDTVEDSITGLSSVQSIPVVFCKKHVYRIEGQFDQFGRGGMSHVRISDTAGCVSNLSIVQAEQNLFWAGNDGFYCSDGYKVQKISDDNNDNYKSLIANATLAKRIYGKFDEANRRIIWAVQKDSANLDNDSAWVLDLRWGVKPDSTFTTWSGTSFAPTAFEFFNGLLYRADKRGYVFKHSEIYFTDPKIDTNEFVVDWVRETIIWSYKTLAMNFGSTFVRKWVPRMLLTATNQTNVSIQVTGFNDDGKFTRPLKEIRWRRNFIWGDPEFVWGTPGCVWNAEGLIEEWRRFPAKGLRLSYLQLQVTNSYTIITNSDTIGTATFNALTNQVLLDNAVQSDWPIEAVGYFISTAADNYVKQYEIITRSNDTLEVLDPADDLPNGSLKWQISGYRKDEILNLLALSIHYANLSKSQKTFESGDSGGNT
jgi:hypothetical protein